MPLVGGASCGVLANHFGFSISRPGEELGHRHAEPLEGLRALPGQVVGVALAVDVVGDAVVVHDPVSRDGLAREVRDRRPRHREPHPRHELLVVGVVVGAARAQARPDLGRVAQHLGEIGLRPLPRGVLGHVDDHHVGRIEDRRVRGPIQRHRRFPCPRRADEDHAGVFEAGQNVLRLDEIGGLLGGPRAGMRARRADDVIPPRGLGDRQPLGGAHGFETGRDHALQSVEGHVRRRPRRAGSLSPSC